MAIELLAEHEAKKQFSAPCFLSKVPAGFPSPADDYVDKKLDLNDLLIKNPPATFYCRVSGNSVSGIGIFDGDLLIVDRSITAKTGKVIIACLDGELTCKIFDKENKKLFSAHPDYPPIQIPEDSDFVIEGVVIHCIRSFDVRIGGLQQFLREL